MFSNPLDDMSPEFDENFSLIDVDNDEPPTFDRYFTLEEAVGLLSEIKHILAQSHAELRQVQDDIILYKRMHDIREDEGASDESDESVHIRTVLKEKWNRFDGALHFWQDVFKSKGILLKSLQKGLLDFPYKTQSGEVYFLCWHYGEEGILFFHDAESGFSGRKPITLLPD